jgi:hypothetical protein
LAQLKEAGVDLSAYLGFPAGRGRQSQIDLVPQDAGALRRTAEKAGLALTGPKPAFLIQGDDRVGAVADVTRRLSDARINITAAAAAWAGGGRYGMILWVAQSDYETAARALGV